MENIQQPIISPELCIICFANANTSCSNCHNAFYCSRDHQLQDLQHHKESCRKNAFCDNVDQLDFPSFLPEEWCRNNLPTAQPEELNMIPSSSTFDSAATTIEKTSDYPPLTEDELFSSFSNEFLSSANNLWDLINNCEGAQDLFDAGNFLNKEPELLSIQEPSPSNQILNHTNQIPQSEQINQIPQSAQINQLSQSGQSDQIAQSGQSNQIAQNGQCNQIAQSEQFNQMPQSEQPILDKKVLNLMGGASLQSICSNVVQDLNQYGICVLDKFLGDTLGNLILMEVKNLYNKGIFKKGELVVPNPFLAKENVRSDVTMWVNGTEAECLYIGHLMQVLDIVMTTCNKFQDSGALAKYKLHRRTKAMIACYPGDGTHYKKHIDNPHKDGRCVTCIYYLNKNWNTETDGGMLRMFPSVMVEDIAQIEPIFDRMIFFWSDKRNPHEVLKAFRTRFAITVWYFDADERDRALVKARARGPRPRKPENLVRN